MGGSASFNPKQEARELEQQCMSVTMYARTWTAVGGQVAVAGSVAPVTAVDAAVFVVSTGVGPRVS